MPESFDILIIGGGYSGLGLARTAAFHGLTVCLIEAGEEPGGGVSANALRIVHGGFRYLQRGAVGRVIESARAKRLALEHYPDLVSPLPCLMPLARSGFRSALPVRAALAAYRLLARPLADQAGAILSSAAVDNASGLLRGCAPHGALQWWDALVHDPKLLMLRLAKNALSQGAQIRNGHKALEVRLERDVAVTKVSSARGESEIHAKVVVNAAGPAVSAVSVPGIARPQYLWCRGFNLVLNRLLDPRYAVAGEGNGRLLFAVPRETVSAAGTWYVAPNSDAKSAAISDQEIDAAIADLIGAFPHGGFKREDVQGVEAGLLPVARFKYPGTPLLAGRERIFYAGRYCELLSTKFTTFEVQAERILRGVAPLLQ